MYVVLATIAPFVSPLNFLDPLQTTDGKPYSYERYKEIVQERYFISKYINTSYTDTGNITPLERGFLVDFIKEEIETKRRAAEQRKREREAKK